MKLILVYLSLCLPLYTIAQGGGATAEVGKGEVHFHDNLNIGADRGPKAEAGPKGEPGPRGGSDGNKNGSNTTVSVGPGKVTVSQWASDAVIALLQEYYGTDFFSSMFSPSILPTNGPKAILISRLDKLAKEASDQNRTKDVNFINDLSNKIKNGEKIDFKFSRPNLGNIPYVSIYEPRILHNIAVRTPSGQFPGMLITVPGYMTNATGKFTELLIRFYTLDGIQFKANIFEQLYKDRNGFLVTGTGASLISENFINLSLKSFPIPYYALNLQPTNGTMTYHILAKAILYVDNVAVSTSAPTELLVKY
ncbi:hypothetical protein ADIARSV_2591 [Arcticibacter svalbardensis MN12-7]|uniref:Uncharacterized protein n=1 Tax=Arcticibacter svalbardensis MN12-7 TaxID=1150600 RepID=R9GRT1_9SPHI|nr:collagen-like protein [Arcticibacter svalbardensis]EOR94240.1 hypothetical protein ADIARSV_2591 [Arcticibacter svalbardensis MN12-7]